MKTSRKMISVLLAILLIALAAPTAFADDPAVRTVPYVDENGEARSVAATVLTPRTAPYGAAGETNWYVIEGEYEGADRVIILDASANLILADDADWTITGTSGFNIIIADGSVNLYAQKNGTGSLKLDSRIASIYGDVAIYGGSITAEAVQASTNSGTLYIGGGVINTEAFYCKNMVVSGGEIHTQSTMGCYGSITVSGGEIEAVQTGSGGSMAMMCENDLLITGGKVTSSGMFGLYSSNGSVTITGGTVRATGTSMGISGRKGISVSGGNVIATGATTMGLLSGGPISLTGGTVFAEGGTYGVCPNAEDVVVTLGAATPDTVLKINSFSPEIAVVVREGQTLTDGENDYTGALTADEVASLAGKTLVCRHAWSWVVDSDPNCGKAGVKHEECAACGAVRSEDTVIPASGGHTIKVVNAKEATATEDGYTGDEVCSVCGQTVRTGEIIPAAGSNADGFDGTCPYCGEKHGPGLGWIITVIHTVMQIIRICLMPVTALIGQ